MKGINFLPHIPSAVTSHIVLERNLRPPGGSVKEDGELKWFKKAVAFQLSEMIPKCSSFSFKVLYCSFSFKVL